MKKINRTTRNFSVAGSAAFLCLARDAGLDPFDELVLGDGHTLADLQCREAFAVHQLISIGAGDAKHLRNVVCGECQRQLFKGSISHRFPPFLFGVIRRT